MDAEILFFMREKDQDDFLAFAQKQVDSIEAMDSGFFLKVGDCQLKLVSSFIQKSVLYSGKLEIRHGKPESTCQDLEKAKSTFRKLRNWIKKKYWSRLAYLDQNKNNRLTPTRMHWLAPDAKQWKDENPEKHIIKLSLTSWMVFDIGF